MSTNRTWLDTAGRSLHTGAASWRCCRGPVPTGTCRRRPSPNCKTCHLLAWEPSSCRRQEASPGGGPSVTSGMSWSGADSQLASTIAFIRGRAERLARIDAEASLEHTQR
eukprot:6218972-Prymnesium_polylepis.1